MGCGGNPMALPYKISTLLYVFDDADRVLLLERAREPNRGLWSPPGGKLKSDIGESPWACAAREAEEELGQRLGAADLHLTGIISEEGYEGTSHWLMFLFEVLPRLNDLPAPIAEGRFQFYRKVQLESLPLPDTDRERIWPLFWKHRRGFFAAHCRCMGGGSYAWELEASRPSERWDHLPTSP